MKQLKPSFGARYGNTDTIPVPASKPVLDTLLAHRSCRQFADRDIPDDLRSLLFAAAQSAPSKSNLQQYSLLEVVDVELRQQLKNELPSVAWAFEAPLLLVILGDLHRNRFINAFHEREYRAHPLDAFLNATVDAALVMQALITAAESLGLGTCPISKIRARIGWVSDLLQLPEGVFPICALAIGYPHVEADRVAPRLPQNLVIHRSRYTEPRRTEITDYDAIWTAQMGEPKPRYVDRFGLPETPSWSDNVARQTAVEERSDFTEYLRRQRIVTD